MPYSINLRVDLGLVELVFAGGVDLDQLRETRHKIRPLLADEKLQSALIDMREIEWRLSAAEILEFAGSIQQPPPLRIAILCRPDDPNSRFFETVAKNRNRAVELFTDAGKAREALKKWSLTPFNG